MSRKSRHHLVPRSRNGKEGENVKLISDKKHLAWHLLFSNLTPTEIIVHIVLEWTPPSERRKTLYEAIKALQDKL